MKRLLVIVPFLFLLGCQGSDPNEGYQAGYDLTCGFSWSGRNTFVLEKEYAYNFLAGARACARKHPERVRQVLGLVREGQTASTTESDMGMESVPEKPREQQELLPSATLQTETVQAPIKPGKSPVKAKALVQSEPPKKAQPATVKKTPAKAKAKAPSNAKAPKKPKAPVKTEARPEADAPVSNKAAVELVEISSKDDKASVSPLETVTPSVADGPQRQAPQKKPVSTYNSFMGE